MLQIYCGRCSANFVPLPHFNYMTPVRVCNHCFLFQVTPFTVNEWKRHLTDGVEMLPVFCQVIVSCHMFRCVSCFVFDFCCLFHFCSFYWKVLLKCKLFLCVCILDTLLWSLINFQEHLMLWKWKIISEIKQKILVTS